MTLSDQFLLALTAWRENRGGGRAGMQSVINVICNRANNNNTSPYVECVRPWQFSSITATGDPELILWPAETDEAFATAKALAASAVAGELADITGGAIDYYAPASIKATTTYKLPDGQVIPFPRDWNAAAVTYTCTIGGQVFFKG